MLFGKALKLSCKRLQMAHQKRSAAAMAAVVAEVFVTKDVLAEAVAVVATLNAEKAEAVGERASAKAVLVAAMAQVLIAVAEAALVEVVLAEVIKNSATRKEDTRQFQ
mgnify:CR=1 FL=1